MNGPWIIRVPTGAHVVRERSTSTLFPLKTSMMRDAAESLDFEKAIALRDQIKKLNERLSGK